MSGTSMDGVDAALLETDGTADFIEQRGHTFFAYPPLFKILLKATEYAVKSCAGDLLKVKSHFLFLLENYLKIELGIPPSQINEQVRLLSVYLYGKENNNQAISLDAVILHSTQLHGLAIKKLLDEKNLFSHDIDVVGYPGQTLFHQPSSKISIIVGEGKYLAEKSGITVVNDFRSNDLKVGGQGAPLAPLYHYSLAQRAHKIPLAVVNCGGIANITLINSQNEFDLVAFDSGPGNALIDKFMRRRTQGKVHMDQDGYYGKQGKVVAELLPLLYEKSTIKSNRNYFLDFPPKSLDYNDMVLIPELDSLSMEEGCATLSAFTADTIVKSLDLLKVTWPSYWGLVGGGWKNPLIYQQFVDRLNQRLGKQNVQILTEQEMGWNSQALEAQAFAYLAVRSLLNKPLSFPKTTGASRPVSGGKAYLPPQGPTKAVQRLVENHPAVLGYSNIQ